MELTLYLIVIYSVALINLLVASILDIRTREVPDWLNYGLIASGFGINLIFSSAYWDYHYILNSFIGFAIFFILSYIMFYTGQWGGGDSKILMGLGALIGIKLSFSELPFLASFLINTLLIGAVYGFIWSVFLAIRNRKRFSLEIKKTFAAKAVFNARRIVLFITLILLVSVFYISDGQIKILIFSLASIIILTFYLWIFVKAVEKTCMIKYIRPQQLTEGDWIAQEIKLDGKYVTGPKDLGIEKKKISRLIKAYRQGKIKKVLIKEGIPFVPSFLLAFIMTILIGNVFLLLF